MGLTSITAVLYGVSGSTGAVTVCRCLSYNPCKIIQKFGTASNGAMLVTHFVKTCPHVPKMKQTNGQTDNEDHLYGRY